MSSEYENVKDHVTTKVEEQSIDQDTQITRTTNTASTSGGLSDADISFYASRPTHTSALSKFQSQFNAFFIKNAILMKRQWSTTLTKFLVPLIIISLPVLMSIIIDESETYGAPDPVNLYDEPGMINVSRELPFYHYALDNNDPDFSDKVGSMPISSYFRFDENRPFLNYAYRKQGISGMPYHLPFMHPSNSPKDLYHKLENFNDFYFHYSRKDPKNNTEFEIQIKNNITNGHFDYVPSYGAIIFNQVPNTTSTKQIFSYLIMAPHVYGKWMPYYKNPEKVTEYQLEYPQGEQYGYIMSFLHNILGRYFAINPDLGMKNTKEFPRILTRYQGFPYKEKAKFPVMDFTSVFVIGFVTLFLLPIYLSQFVRDKQDRHLIMMRINGLNMLNYWIANYLFCFLEYSIIMSIFCLVALAIGFNVIAFTSPLVTILLLFCWGWSMISMAAFLSLFFTRVRTALFAGTLLICLGQIAGNMMYNSAYVCSIPPSWMMLYPPFSCGYALHKICEQCNIYHCYTTKRFFQESVSTTLYWMIGESVLLTILTIYLHEVIPQEFGTRKPFLFFLKYLSFCKHKKDHSTNKEISLDEIAIDSQKTSTPINDSNTNTSKINSDLPALAIDSVTKVYSDGKVALSDYSLNLNDGEFFGLLGPNGAGKTTLLSILSGQLEATHGKFYLHGRLCDANRLHKGILGTCPQFDVFYPDLTVLDHLRFYARIRCLDELFHVCKDMSNASHHYDRESQLNRILHETGLVSVRHQKAKLLCGGMRRRLSLAIALLGNPRIVILDEPTTGLDPCTRRELWKVFKDVNQVGKRTILMTTHAMDEADFLCHKVAIMSSGKILCSGTPEELKLIYGQGYKLTILCSPIQRKAVLNDLSEKFLSKMDIQYMPNYSWNDRLILQLKLHTYDPSDILTLSASGSENSDKKQEIPRSNISESESSDPGINTSGIQSRYPSLMPVYSPLEYKQHKILSKLILYLNDQRQRAIITDWGLDSPTLEDVFLYQCTRNGYNYKEFTETKEISNITKSKRVDNLYNISQDDTNNDSASV